MKFDPTPFIRPNFHGPLVAVLTGFHYSRNAKGLQSKTSLQFYVFLSQKSKTIGESIRFMDFQYNMTKFLPKLDRNMKIF